MRIFPFFLMKIHELARIQFTFVHDGCRNPVFFFAERNCIIKSKPVLVFFFFSVYENILTLGQGVSTELFLPRDIQ